MKTICYICIVFIFNILEARTPHSIAYATRLYWSGDADAKSRALKRFKEISESKTHEIGERGYCRLYLGKTALESGDIKYAKKILAQADLETDAFWGDELLLEYFETKHKLNEYDRKRNELLRLYTIRRDSILQGSFDVQRIWWMLSCSLLERGSNCNPEHYLRYRFMYRQHNVDKAMRLSLYLDYCNERIYELSGKIDVFTDTEMEMPEFKTPITMNTVTLKPKSCLPNLLYWGPAGYVEGMGMVYWYSKGHNLRLKFALHLRKEILSAAGVEYNVRTLYKGVIRNGKVLLYDVDGNLFESPFFTIDKGFLKIKVQYRICRTPRNSPIFYFFGWQGIGDLHTDYLLLRLPHNCL